MKLVSFRRGDATAGWGILDGDQVIDCAAVMRGFVDLDAVFQGGALASVAAAAHTAPVLATADLTLRAPLQRPGKILCVGLNYLAHILEGGRTPSKYPAIFTRYPASLVGPEEAMIAPKVSERFDFEGELAFVVGKSCHQVAAKDAMAYVAGYTAFNDGSIRDYQRHTSQFWPGKNFYKSGAIGPSVVTADEFGDPDKAHLRTILNGQEMQTTPISDLAVNIPQIIAYVSSVLPLEPGDVVATGTPGGVGTFREPPIYMKAGDVIEVEISGIGTLRNPILDEG